MRRFRLAKRIRAKSRPKRVARTTLRKIVKKEIAKRVEVKTINYGTVGGTLITNNGNATVTNGFTLDLTQGVQEGQRVGNEVRMKSFVVKGHVTLNYAGSMTPCVVRLVLCKVRQQITPPSPTQLALILNNGGAAAPMDYQLQSLYWDINTDLFEVVADKKMKIGVSNIGGGGVGTPTNNDFNLFKTFKMRVPIKGSGKLLKYQDALTPCTNHAYFLVAQYVYPNQVQDVPAAFNVNVFANVVMKYTDA